jgi:hypothetical protein
MVAQLLSLILAQAASVADLPQGRWSNEEDVYFAREAGKAPPPWLGIEIGPEGRPRAVDAFGTPSETEFGALTAQADGSIRATLSDGAITTLRRARPVTCWSAIRKEPVNADKPTEWHFVRGITLHDQGGRALVGKGVAGAKPVILRMRNVAWPSGPNRPSLVLYVHTEDYPASAVSYAWADPDAVRLGINLRWMQASCTLDGLEPPAPPATRP